MSTVASSAPVFELEAAERTASRYTGWMIAISAATALWGALGIGIWGLVSLVG